MAGECMQACISVQFFCAGKANTWWSFEFFVSISFFLAVTLAEINPELLTSNKNGVVHGRSFFPLLSFREISCTSYSSLLSTLPLPVSLRLRSEPKPSYSPQPSWDKISILISYLCDLPHPLFLQHSHARAAASWMHNCTFGKHTHGCELPEEGASAQRAALLTLLFVIVIRGCGSSLLWLQFSAPIKCYKRFVFGAVVIYLLLFFFLLCPLLHSFFTLYSLLSICSFIHPILLFFFTCLLADPNADIESPRLESPLSPPLYCNLFLLEGPEWGWQIMLSRILMLADRHPMSHSGNHRNFFFPPMALRQSSTGGEMVTNSR